MKKYEFSTIFWNICTGDDSEVRPETSWKTRAPHVQNLLKRNTCDIMSLVELSRSGKNEGMNIYELCSTFSDHHLVFRSYGGYSLGALINTRKFAVSNVRVFDLLPDISSLSFIMMIVDVVHKKSKALMSLVVTHFPTNFEYKQTASMYFVNIIEASVPQDRVMLICGDFNTEGEENYTALENHIPGAQVITREFLASIDLKLHGTYLGFRGIDKRFRTLEYAKGLDIIMTRDIESKPVEIVDFELHTYGDTCETYTYPSDHLAIKCQMFITQS